MGDGATTSLRLHNINGRAATTSRADTELLIDAYSGEFAEFASAIQEHRSPVVGEATHWPPSRSPKPLSNP